MVDVTIPRIGESINTVFVSKWLKKPGESVAEGEGVVELDSDKASMEVPSPAAGVLREQLVVEGAEVPIGTVVARIEAGAAAEKPATQAGPPAGPSGGPQAAPPSQPPSPQFRSPEGEDRQLAPGSRPQAAPAASPGADGEDGEVRAGPAARQEAQLKGVPLSQVQGTGPRGRVTSDDVRRAPSPGAPAAAAAPAAAGAPRAEQRQGNTGGALQVRPAAAEQRIERVPMSPLRRTIARRLVEAQQTAAMLTTFNEVDMSRVMALRKQYQDRFVEKHGVKLGFMSFFVKAVIEGLKEFPAVNAEIDGDEILYKHFYDIGVAVSGPKGLVVPVVRDADRLSFAELELAIGELATRARDNKLRIEDFEGGTFTLSNGGVFGSLMSTPILNPPQVGILGMHAIQERPVGIDGRIELRPMMYLALSYDHRIIDGREAVSFLVRVKQCVEDPQRILLEM